MFSLLHWIPSAVSALVVSVMVFVFPGKHHKILGLVAVSSALLGLAGYIEAGQFFFLGLDIHTIHADLGISTLVVSVYTFGKGMIGRKNQEGSHCNIGYLAGLLSVVSLVIGASLLLGTFSGESDFATDQVPASSTLPEVEAREFLGVSLTSLAEQRNNAIQGTQYIDAQDYTLKVWGLVQNELEIGLGELHQLPAYSQAAYMPCVEGWGFSAKWTGFRVSDLLNMSGLMPEASYVMFHSYDGYSTGLPLSYLVDAKILLAYGINDLTLPADRGYPLQLVALHKYGYKWAKWVTEIEILSEEALGFWETRGYSNAADVGGSPYG